MPHPNNKKIFSLWKHITVACFISLLAACGGGGGGDSASSTTTAPLATDPSITPSSDPGTTPPPPTDPDTTEPTDPDTTEPTDPDTTEPTDPGTTPPIVTAPLVVGTVGCSVTHNAVSGYHRLGGRVLWSFPPGYPGGSVSAWALDLSTLNPYWQDFDAALAANPDTDAIWWQLCTDVAGASQDTFANAQVIASEIRRRAPNARIFVSAQHSYSDVICLTAGENGPAQMQSLADQLIAANIAEAGPILGPLSASETKDSCHANASGELVLGAQLFTFLN